MPGKIGIAIVGVGKIAIDQHIPAIAANDRFEEFVICTGAAGITPRSELDGVEAFTTQPQCYLLHAAPGMTASVPTEWSSAAIIPSTWRHPI